MMNLLLANTVTIICIIIAGILIYSNKEGWAWFLALALVFGHLKGGGHE